ncbi:MAG: mandelate racemase/muconate lactonizing enzyme family protein [Treponema sp.]|nr:mandelate racemase/muconate lactonizing enzyme family protein [Treponema sp.]
MKIRSIDVIQVESDRPMWRPIICRIFTDEGIHGDGEAALAYGIAAPAAFGMIRDLAKKLIGLDPMDNEVIWDRLYKETFWGQNGGPVVFAGISALDVALWDIKGKALKLPLYKLLGGKRRESLRCYASQLQFGWDEEPKMNFTAEELALTSQKAVAEGYDAIKIDFFMYDKNRRPHDPAERTCLLSPYFVNQIKEKVAAVRDAVGPNVDIIMENHSFTDANSAVQIGRAVQEYNIFYFEEPNTPNPKTAKYISERLEMPIASGERIYSRWQYAPYFEQASLQVIQPDIGNCGGITETKKICDLAYIYDVSVQIHVCASPLLTAVSLHLESVIPNFVIHEHHVNNLHDYNRKLCIYDYQPVNGRYTIPELPGIGNEFSEYALTHGEKVTVK